VEIEMEKLVGISSYRFLDMQAEKIKPGSDGLIVLPYLMGERTPLWDKNTKGGFIGFTLFNEKGDLIRAVYEGIAYALRSVIDVFEDNSVKLDRLALVGGGAKSPFWNSIMCNIFRKPVYIHKYPREATSLGAAMAAGVGVGIFKDFESAAGIVEYERHYSVDAKKAEDYKKYYRIYKMMYPQLKPIFDEISEL
jgi:xylulokinase